MPPPHPYDHGGDRGHHSRPEPMNASPHHPKVNVTVLLPPDPVVLAGTHVSGKIELECKADRGLALGMIKAELTAIEELTSRDHSATSTFLHTTRLFQGPGHPPSNAVLPHPLPNEAQPPLDYYQARRGKTSFLFRFPLPRSSPSSVDFAHGLARVRYQVRASVAVSWKGERRLVTATREAVVAQAEDEEQTPAEAVAVGENGKIWVQGRVLGSVLIAGESACVELQVKNHSNKKNSGLNLSLTRHLYLSPTSSADGPPKPPPLELSDSLAAISFSSPEYIIPPGGEGVAHLVFHVPPHARGVRGGVRDGGQDERGRRRRERALFEVQCVLGVKMTMGFGSKDIDISIPVQILHPAVLPAQPNWDAPTEPPQLPHSPQPYDPPYAYTSSPSVPQEPWDNNFRPISPYSQPFTPPAPFFPPPALPISPAPYTPYLSQNASQVFLPPPPLPHHHPFSGVYPPSAAAYYLPPIEDNVRHSPWALPPRSASVEPQPALQQWDAYPMHPAVHSQPPVPPMQPVVALQTGLPGGPGALSTLLQNVYPGGPLVGTHAETEGMAVQAAAAWSATAPAAEPPDVEGGTVVTPTKGARAARISAHLRMTSRTRSLSPPGVRASVGVAPPIPETEAVFHREGATAPYATMHVMPTRPLLQHREEDTVEVISPRPMLSPRHSFSEEPTSAPAGTFTRDPSESPTGTRGRPKSVRVEALEQIADAADDALQRDMSGAGSVVGQVLDRLAESGSGDSGNNRDKTLPVPPVPSGKPSASLVPRPRADALFVPPRETSSPPLQLLGEPRVSLPSALTSSPPPAPILLPADMLSKTPVGRAPGLSRSWSAVKVGAGTRGLGMASIAEDAGPSASSSSRSKQPEATESGLDLLERRLLAQVGTRKLEEEEGRVDARVALGVSPIAIPPPTARISSGPDTPLNDSAISSLTLANGARSLDERTQLGESPGRSPPTRMFSRSPPVIRASPVPPAALRSNSSAEEKPPTEVNKMRKAAKGRVAAWLRNVSPAACEPPAADSIAPSPEMAPPRALSPELSEVEARLRSEAEDADAGVFDMDAKAPTPAPEEPQKAKEEAVDVGTTRADPRSSGFMPLSTLKKQAARFPGPSTRLPAFPPPVDPEVKYDIRSARGGRGGRVTAATALWSAQAGNTNKQEAKTPVPATANKSPPSKPTFADKVKAGVQPAVKPTPPAPMPKPPALRANRSFAIKAGPSNGAVTSGKMTPPRPGGAGSGGSSPSRPPSAARAKTPTNLTDLTGARARMAKSTSVPALLSASLATPTLSSTASLARPVASRSTAGAGPLLARMRSSDALGAAPQRLPLPTVSEGDSIENGRRTPRAATPRATPASPTVSRKAHETKPATPPPKAEMAFGQARLRDLIRKYQGQS